MEEWFYNHPAARLPNPLDRARATDGRARFRAGDPRPSVGRRPDKNLADPRYNAARWGAPPQSNARDRPGDGLAAHARSRRRANPDRGCDGAAGGPLRLVPWRRTAHAVTRLVYWRRAADRRLGSCAGGGPPEGCCGPFGIGATRLSA